MTGCGNAQPGGCFVTAHDANTGEEMWRFYTIARPDTPEGNTWNGLPLESRFGASAWIAGSYDPEQNLIFMALASPIRGSPRSTACCRRAPSRVSRTKRSITNSTLALDLETGELQMVPPAPPDRHAGPRLRLRADADRPAGRRRDAQDRGHDRQDRHHRGDRPHHRRVALGARRRCRRTSSLAIDPKTGEKTINPEAMPQIGQTTMNCPADPGGRGWPATAYSPETQILYLPLDEFCSNTTPQPLDPGQVYTRRRPGDVRPRAGAGQRRQHRPDRRDQADGPVDGVVVPPACADHERGAADGGRPGVRRRSTTASSMPSTTETGEVLWKTEAEQRDQLLPDHLHGRTASSMSRSSQPATPALRRSCGSLTPEIKTPPDHGASLWVFAPRR